ncbi:MAG TPA: hypothetical protein VIJ71_10130 [Mycobacteriales bacterium]
MPPFLRLVPLPRSFAENLPKPIAAYIGLVAELPGAMVKLPQALVMKGFELAGRYEELARTGAELVAGRDHDDEVDEFADYPSIEGWASTPLRAVEDDESDEDPSDVDDVPAALVDDPAAEALVRAAADRETVPSVVVSRQDLPIEDYDSLSATALRAKVGALSAAQLATVRDYEAAHAKRLTVLQLLERKIAAAH